MQKIIPFLWFDHQAEEAVKFYASIFKKSKIGSVTRYGAAGEKAAGVARGTVMTVDFEIEGQQFTALNGGPIFKFNESISFVVRCKNQREIDYYWNKLSKGGDKESQQCGWLKDKFGVSWQIVPENIGELLRDKDPEKSERVMTAVLKMRKIDVKKLEKARRA